MTSPEGAAAQVQPAGNAALLELLSHQAFDPLPMRTALGQLHVPFDALTGTQSVEAALQRAATAGVRVAVSGPSGAGKSSMISYALAEASQNIAVLRVPVEAEHAETLNDPARFAAHMLTELARQATAAKQLSRTQKRSAELAAADAVTHEHRRVTRGGLTVAPWLLKADLAAEAHSVLTATRTPSASATLEALSQLVEVIGARSLFPVVLLDDSDAWLQTPAGDRTTVIGPFFNRVLRDVAQELVCGWVVAVHDTYLQHPAFPHGSGVLQSRISLPRLPAAAAVQTILDRRLDAVAEASSTPRTTGVMTAAVGEGLFRAYSASPGNIREMMQLAHAALEAACNDGSGQIVTEHLEVAYTRFR